MFTLHYMFGKSDADLDLIVLDGMKSVLELKPDQSSGSINVQIKLPIGAHVHCLMTAPWIQLAMETLYKLSKSINVALIVPCSLDDYVCADVPVRRKEYRHHIRGFDYTVNIPAFEIMSPELSQLGSNCTIFDTFAVSFPNYTQKIHSKGRVPLGTFAVDPTLIAERAYDLNALVNLSTIKAQLLARPDGRKVVNYMFVDKLNRVWSVVYPATIIYSDELSDFDPRCAIDETPLTKLPPSAWPIALPWGIWPIDRPSRNPS